MPNSSRHSVEVKWWHRTLLYPEVSPCYILKESGAFGDLVDRYILITDRSVKLKFLWLLFIGRLPLGITIILRKYSHIYMLCINIRNNLGDTDILSIARDAMCECQIIGDVPFPMKPCKGLCSVQN